MHLYQILMERPMVDSTETYVFLENVSRHSWKEPERGEGNTCMCVGGRTAKQLLPVSSQT